VQKLDPLAHERFALPQQIDQADQAEQGIAGVVRGVAGELSDQRQAGQRHERALECHPLVVGERLYR